MGRALVCGAAGLALVAIASARWSASSPTAVDAGAPTSIVVAAASDLGRGSVLEDSMLTRLAVPGQVAAGLVTDPRTVRGKVLLVPVGRGQALMSEAVASRTSGPGQGRRLLTLAVATTDDIGPDVGPGSDADVIGSFAGTSAGERPQVTVIAMVRVVAIAAATPAAATGPVPGPPVAASGASSAGATITIDCAAADALRIVWARDNSHSLLLVGHPTGDAALTPVDDVMGRR